jgi:FkbM family methyltransferase
LFYNVPPVKYYKIEAPQKLQVMHDDFEKVSRESVVDKIKNGFRFRVTLPAQGLMFDLFCRGQFKTDGCSFEIPKNLTTIRLRGSCFDNTYENPERTLVHKFIRTEDSVLELGACLGIVSCTTNKQLRDQSRSLVVEANPKCIPILQKNRDFNKCAFRIEHCAVCNEKETTLFLSEAGVLSATLKSTSAFPVTVPGRTLAELFRQHGPFSVLIMDIEGSELEVLESSIELLPNFRLIIVEFHPGIIGVDGVNRCREILQRSKFKYGGCSAHTEAWLLAD